MIKYIRKLISAVITSCLIIVLLQTNVMALTKQTNMTNDMILSMNEMDLINDIIDEFDITSNKINIVPFGTSDMPSERVYNN